MREGSQNEKKSLSLIASKNPDWKKLVKECVAFANATGGHISIGIENEDALPPSNQKIPDSLAENIQKQIQHRTLNVGVVARKLIAENGGQYIDLTVLRSAQTIASTSDGRYFIRVSDEAKPLLPDELGRLMNDKNAYVWESQTNKQIPREHCDSEKCLFFLNQIRNSDRVSRFVKEKSSDEILEHYFFVKGQYLTNLGVLWIGKREDRANLLYSPVIQFIKYDESERKVNKLLWDEYRLNPHELIDAVWSQIPDWKESHEIPDGLFRKNIPHYEEVVIRELLANALVHRPYTQRGDIFLNLYPDRLEVHNPGLLPLGVTPSNILHASVKRNEHLAKVFYDLKLMEREGSGFDKMYETLLCNGKPAPVVREEHDRVVVTVFKKIVKPEVIDLIGKANEKFGLKQKELIALGFIAQHEALSALKLSKALELNSEDRLTPWLERLTHLELIRSKGRTRGKEYFVNPSVLKVLQFKGKTSLKGIEPHRLKELVLKDVSIYQPCSIEEIQKHIGDEIPKHKIRKILRQLETDKSIKRSGTYKHTRYYLTTDGK